MKLFKKLNLPFENSKLLVLLLVGDLFYILIHIISTITGRFDLDAVIRKPVFRINVDLGIAESFQYVKEFWILLAFIWLVFKQKKYSFLGWIVLFFYLLLDDMSLIRELFVQSWLQTAGLEPLHGFWENFRLQDFGELIISIFVGVIFFVYFIFIYYRSKPENQNILRNLAMILLLLAFFGVIVDFIGHAIDRDPFSLTGGFVALIEDGGEMVAMSIMCWYVYSLAEKNEGNQAEIINAKL